MGKRLIGQDCLLHMRENISTHAKGQAQLCTLVTPELMDREMNPKKSRASRPGTNRNFGLSETHT